MNTRAPSAESFQRLGELSLLACAVLLPTAFLLRTYDSASIKLAILHWTAIIAAFSWLWQGLAQGRFTVAASSWTALAPALLLGAWMVARFATSEHRIAALSSALNQGAMLAAYLAAFIGLAGARSAFHFCAFVVAGAWIVAAYALAQAVGLDPFLWRGAYGEGLFVHRAFSTLGNPDFCAAYLAVAAPMALTLELDPESPRPLRWAALALLPVAGAAATLTESPVGAVTFALVCALYGLLVPLALRTPAALRTGALALTIAGLAGAAAWGAGAFADHPSAGGRKGRKDFSTRVEQSRLINAGAVRLAAERPLTGHGTGAFSIEYPRARPAELIRLEGGHNTMTDYADASALTVAAELGLIGAALWFWLFGAAVWTGLRGGAELRRAGAASESVYAAGLSAIAAGGLVASQLSVAWQFAAPGWFLWATAGLGAGLAPLAARRAPVSVWPLPVSEGVRRAFYAPTMLAFLALLLPPGIWLKADVDHNKAIAHAKHREWSQAIALWEKIPRGSANYVMSLYFRGNASLDQDLAKDALEYYDRLRESAPDYVLVHAKRGEALGRLGRWEEAAQARARQAELDPLYVPNLVAWAEAARAAGDLAQARKAVELALAEKPDDAGAKLQSAANNLQEKRLAAKARGQRGTVARSTRKAGRPSTP